MLFVGGDPVVHPDFLESLEIAKSLGLNVSVLSNSWAIRPVEKFERALSLIDSCEATILGATSETHDALTQRKGSFEQLMANLQQMAVFGHKVGICANAMPQNLDQIYDIVDHMQTVRRIPVRRLMIQRIIPSGGATGDFKFGLNLNDVEKLMAQIDRVVTTFGLPFSFEDPVPWCTVNPKYHKYLAKCLWGYSRGSVNSNGLLNRCGADDHSRLGSIWDGNIQEIWRSHPILRSFRSKQYLPDECKTCDLLNRCGGGCPLSCGTFKDHDIDQLYIQRIQRQATGRFKPNAPTGAGYEKPLIRYAFDGDLKRIVSLETEIFRDSGPLFQRGNIKEYFAHCPKAFRVASMGARIVGYSVIFPLTSEGVAEVERNAPPSVICMKMAGLSSRFTDSLSGLYIEVVAVAPETPPAIRIGLLKNLLRTIHEYSVPTYTCPITKVGLKLTENFGFARLAQTGEQTVFVLRPTLSAITES